MESATFTPEQILAKITSNEFKFYWPRINDKLTQWMENYAENLTNLKNGWICDSRGFVQCINKLLGNESHHALLKCSNCSIGFFNANKWLINLGGTEWWSMTRTGLTKLTLQQWAMKLFLGIMDEMISDMYLEIPAGMDPRIWTLIRNGAPPETFITVTTTLEDLNKEFKDRSECRIRKIMEPHRITPSTRDILESRPVQFLLWAMLNRDLPEEQDEEEETHVDKRSRNE